MRLLPLESVARRPAELEALLARHGRDRYMLALQGPEQQGPAGPAAGLLDRLWTRWVGNGVKGARRPPGRVV
jgi:hypothetical protein